MNKAEPLHAHPATLVALVLFTLVSLGLGVVANLVAASKAGFLRRYFLGNRSLGAFAVALTAAVMSGGTFLGFPSFVYKYGWVVGLWICSYMVAPLTTLGVLGKRIGHIARRTGAITLPDFFRERYGSPALGLLTSLFIILFLGAFLVAQFKAGGVLLKIVLPSSSYSWANLEEIGGDLGPGYVVGLLVFAATVVAYTTYGGFLAAVWTDVFQSIVMAVGVMILLPLALIKAGGLEAATYKGMELAGDGFAFGPGAGRAFHPIGLAFSFFVMWAITGMGQPSTIVRLMAFRDSRTLRYSMIYLTFYNMMVYIPLILIFVCARSILPDLANSDEVMPRLVTTLANPYLAGLILAAPVARRDEHSERLPAHHLLGPGPRPLPAVPAAGRVEPGDRVGELPRDGGRRARRRPAGAATARVPPVDRHLRQRRAGRVLPHAGAARGLLATRQRAGGDRVDARRGRGDARPVCLRLLLGHAGHRPEDRPAPLGQGLRRLLPARPGAGRLGPAGFARRGRGRQPGDAPARPEARLPPLRRPAAGRPRALPATLDLHRDHSPDR